MHFKLQHLLLAAATWLTVAANPVYSQNGVRIAATQGTADQSAMLDVISTEKGMLVPRMTLAQKNAIVNPANGLLVYQTDGSVGFYYNSGTPASPVWVQLSAGALSGTGTTNTVTKWTSGSAVGNSNITDDGSTVTVGGTNTTVTNLSGTGIRQVYANNNGRLMTSPPVATVFSYTGADQTYTVPAGVTSITIKLWGAGGGGGWYGGWSNGWSGGGGGFTQGVLAVTPGQTLTVIVGGGGLGGNTANTAWTYGGGARSCNTGSDCRYGGQGGGRSAIRSGGTELLTAGGGGGGGSTRGNAMNQMWGAGGGWFGQQGMSAHYNFGGGAGGGPIAGGAGGSDVSGVGAAGSQFTGGQPGSNAYGGGGGGGWFGGGGGGYNESHTMGGGGGGSGYIGGAGVTNAWTKVGFYAEPANQQDIHYAAGVAVGGLTQGTSTPLQGGHGRVVIIPNN